MREASSLVLSSRLQGAGARVRAYDPVAEDEARKLIRGVEFVVERGRGGRGRRRGRARDGVAGVPRARPRRAWPARCAGRCSSTGATSSTRRPRAPPAWSTRRSAARRANGDGLMQALILAGGEGTRLRPLTSTVPKPVVPLVDRPFIAFMLDWLRGHGVDDVIMSCGFLAAGVRNVLGDGSAYGVRLRYVEEPQPLGTGGALKFAEELLDERFLMLNGDVLTDLDVTAQLALHEARGARATLALTPVEDPSAYGLVRTHRRRRGDRLRREAGAGPDRHAQHLGRHLRARALRARAARARPAAPRSSATSSRGSSARGCTRYVGEGYWLDIGTPERYLAGHVRHPRGHGARPRSASGWATATSCVEPAHRERGPDHPVGAGRGRLPDRRGRADRRPRRARGRRRRRRGHDDRARRRPARRADRRELHAARLHRRAPARRIGDNTHVEGLAVLGEGVTRRRRQRRHQRRARCSPA